MIALLLAPLLVADGCSDLCVGTARPICCERRRAHDLNDHARALGLVEREVEAVQAERAADPRPVTLDSLRPLCSPIEVGFNLCNEWRPEWKCAGRFLAAYVAEGCLEDPAQVARYFNMQAMHAARGLDYVAALEHTRRAEVQARAIWDARGADTTGTRARIGIAASLATRANIAAQLHRPDAVRAIVDELEDALAPIVARERASAVADARNEVAWALLLAREAGDPGQDPTPLLERALNTYDRVRPNRERADNVRINLALTALQDGELPRVQRWLDEVDESVLGDEGRMWLRLVQVRAALLEGDFVGVDRWQADLDAVGARASTPIAAWFAAWMRGLRHEADGSLDAAIVAYERAEALLESYAHTQGDLDVALADRHYLTYAATSRRLVQLFAEAAEDGDGEALDRAVWTARHARSRALRTAARASCADAQFVRQPPLAPGELSLLYFRLGPRTASAAGTAWLAVALTHRGARAVVLTLPVLADDLGAADEAGLERWSDLLLSPFFPEIDGADAIEILATESLHRVPFHALPWEAGLLLDQATVRYSLDVETCRMDTDLPRGGAVVVQGDDPHFSAEVRAVVDALDDRWAVDVLAPRDAAGLAPLLGGTHAVAHLVSHGRRGDLDRFFDSDDRLQLTRDLALSRRDLLTLSRAPELVFLSACKSSFVDAETFGGSVSVAHAFLLRGSRHVVGAVDDIDGDIASTFATRFHHGLAESGLGDVPEVWREAYLATMLSTSSPGLARQLRVLRLYAR